MRVVYVGWNKRRLLSRVMSQWQAARFHHAQEKGHWLFLATLKEDDPIQQPPFEAVSFPLGRLWG